MSARQAISDSLCAGNVTSNCRRHWAITTIFLGSVLAYNILVSNGPPFSHSTFFRDFCGWQCEANEEEIREICKVKENILERGRLSSRLEALPRGEIIPVVLDMPGTPRKSKVATKLAEKLGRIVENQGKNQGKPNISFLPVVPTGPS